MVASSRSSRGRPTLRSDHNSSESSSPVTATTNTSVHDHNASSVPSHPRSPNRHDDAGSSRAKRNRITSVSDRDSLQKRRRLSKGSAAGPPQVHIPLRGRAAPDNLSRSQSHGNLPRLHPAPPPLITHDSSVSNSPLNSPPYRPQYDQFKRIEEKAQKVVIKNASHDDKRKLRSEHGSTRSKTELAQYFPNFDDMLSLEPIDPDLLAAKTPIILVDDTPAFEPDPPQTNYFRTDQAPHNSEVIRLSQYAGPTEPEEDPLADSVFLKAHLKAERHEKQMKNGDKERAQHEKYQLERLLEELRGPDWLKTLGVSGITETEKKRYEVKRSLFIKETKALIEKFRRWKEEEKRRKIERQQHLLEEAEADAVLTDGLQDDEKPLSSKGFKSKSRVKTETSSRNRSRANSQPVSSTIQAGPDSNEIDALASQQLLAEDKQANLQRHKSSSSTNQASLPAALVPELTNKPFTSFFEKRHIREAAVLGRNRGRKTYAFGHEVPELDEQDFDLPDSILTEDAIKASQRGRRRRMRNVDD